MEENESKFQFSMAQYVHCKIKICWDTYYGEPRAPRV